MLGERSRHRESTGRHVKILSRRSGRGSVVKPHLSRRLSFALAAALTGCAVFPFAAVADSDVIVVGGDAADVVRCVTDGGGKQKNKCSAKASGGDVVLENV